MYAIAEADRTWPGPPVLRATPLEESSMDVLAREAPSLRIDLSPLDLTLLFLFFVWVTGIGFAPRRAMSSSLDFFLAGRSLPSWITGLAFISANLGALEIEALLGIPLPVAVVVSAAFVLSYILLGGVTSAIYTEVLQFFVIIAGLLPLLFVTLKATGGLGALWDRLRVTEGAQFVEPWTGTGPAAPTSSVTGSGSSSASASHCRSRTGRPTSPRCSGPCRPRTTTPPA
jgi:Na+/proline symporter